MHQRFVFRVRTKSGGIVGNIVSEAKDQYEGAQAEAALSGLRDFELRGEIMTDVHRQEVSVRSMGSHGRSGRMSKDWFRKLRWLRHPLRY
jgi:hypothetical protein